MPSYTRQFAHLTGILPSRLGDETLLAGAVIAAAGAVGLTPHGTPIARSSPRGLALGLLGHGGHIVLHAEPDAGGCLVDVVVPAPGSAERAVEVIARRLGAQITPLAHPA